MHMIIISPTFYKNKNSLFYDNTVCPKKYGGVFRQW